MTLKSMMTGDLAVFFNADEFAESVSYTPAGGEAAIITAIVSRDNPLQEPYVRGARTATAEITVKAADVASPQHGDTFTFGGETWEFDPGRGVIYEDSDVMVIGLERQLP